VTDWVAEGLMRWTRRERGMAAMARRVPRRGKRRAIL
jgi:hypothetical protein